MTQDNGARALAKRRSEREREHREDDETTIARHWWRCVPISDAYLYLPDAAELDRLRRIEAAARTRETAEEALADAEAITGEVVQPERIRRISRLTHERAEAVHALRAALAEGSAGTAPGSRRERVPSGHLHAWSEPDAQGVRICLDTSCRRRKAAEGSARDGG